MKTKTLRNGTVVHQREESDGAPTPYVSAFALTEGMEVCELLGRRDGEIIAGLRAENARLRTVAGAAKRLYDAMDGGKIASPMAELGSLLYPYEEPDRFAFLDAIPAEVQR